MSGDKQSLFLATCMQALDLVQVLLLAQLSRLLQGPRSGERKTFPTHHVRWHGTGVGTLHVRH